MADRRTFLRGLATLPVAAGGTALVTASAAQATPSAEAVALLREFRDIASRYNAAGNRLDDAMEATVLVPEPEALFARGQDFWVLGCIKPYRHWRDGRFHYGTDEAIAKLRELAAGDGDTRRRDRRDEIVGAWDRWHADKRAAMDASGETEASDHYQAVGAEHDAFVLRLVHMQTADPDVMKIKAALVLNAWRDLDRFGNAITRSIEGKEDIEDALSLSLMRDVMGQLGEAYRVTS